MDTGKQTAGGEMQQVAVAVKQVSAAAAVLLATASQQLLPQHRIDSVHLST